MDRRAIGQSCHDGHCQLLGEEGRGAYWHKLAATRYNSLMKRHLIVFYVVVVVLLMAGRFAWQNCVWEILSSVSSAAVIASTLIIGWKVIRLRPEAGDEVTLRGDLLAAARMAILVLCVGMLFAGFGDVIGKWAFGCR